MSGEIKNAVKKTGGFLKSIGSQIFGIFSSIFGIGEYKKSKDGQAVMDSFNDFGKALGFKTPFFQTEKEKQKAEKAAEEARRQQIADAAENTRKIAEMLEELNKKF